MTIGLVVLNAKIRAESFRVLLVELMVISEGNPGIDLRVVVIPVLAVEGEGADVRSVMQLDSVALNVLVFGIPLFRNVCLHELSFLRDGIYKVPVKVYTLPNTNTYSVFRLCLSLCFSSVFFFSWLL